MPAGMEIAVHACPGTLDNFGEEDTLTASFTDARDAESFSLIDWQLILPVGPVDQVVLHPSGLALYVHAVHGSAPWLVSGRRRIYMLQGVQQSDPLRMLIFSLALQPLVDKLQEGFALDWNEFCADYGTLIGRLPELHKAGAILQTDGAKFGYHIELIKSKWGCSM